MRRYVHEEERLDTPVAYAISNDVGHVPGRLSEPTARWRIPWNEPVHCGHRRPTKRCPLHHAVHPLCSARTYEQSVEARTKQDPGRLHSSDASSTHRQLGTTD